MLIAFIIFTIVFALSVVVAAYGNAYDFKPKEKMLSVMGVVFSVFSGFGWFMSGLAALTEYMNNLL